MRQKEKKSRGSYTDTLKGTFLIIDDHKIDEIQLVAPEMFHFKFHVL